MSAFTGLRSAATLPPTISQAQLPSSLIEFGPILARYQQQSLAAFQSAETQASAQTTVIAQGVAGRIDQYITDKVTELRARLKESLGKLGEMERGEVARRITECEEMTGKVKRLIEDVKAVKVMEDREIGNVVRETERLGEEVERLRNNIKRETFSVRLSIGFSPPTYFLILHTLTETVQVDAYVHCLPPLPGVPSRVILTRPLVYIPLALDLFTGSQRTPFYSEIHLYDKAGKQLTRKPFVLSSGLLLRLQTVPIGLDFDVVRKEQELLQRAFDVFYERHGEQKPRVSLNVYERLKADAEFGVGEIMEELERVSVKHSE